MDYIIDYDKDLVFCCYITYHDGLAIKIEIEKWLNENCPKWQYINVKGIGFCFDFKNTEDAMAFKLRWS